jgi:hypothetical protein
MLWSAEFRIFTPWWGAQDSGGRVWVTAARIGFRSVEVKTASCINGKRVLIKSTGTITRFKAPDRNHAARCGTMKVN